MSDFEKTKRRIFRIIQIGNKTDVPSTVFDIVISLLIVISITVTFLQTFDSLDYLRPILSGIELVTIIVFTIEYLLRLWTAPYLYEGLPKGRAVWKFIISFYGIVDLLTIASYFAPLFSNGFVALRMLRVVRIMRLFKLNATYDAFNVITDVLKEKKNQILSATFIIFIMLLMSSMCMYSLEHEAQPENFDNAFSGIWWSVSTLLTVGYGDIYPVTVAGKAVAIIISFLGVGLVAIPTGIISAGFVEYYTRIKTGRYEGRQADFVTLSIDENEPECGKCIRELSLPAGLYIAGIIRGSEAYSPQDDFVIKEYDQLLLTSTEKNSVYARLEEVRLAEGHEWINQQIRDLDISRKTCILMIRRKNRVVKPEDATRLVQDDIVVLLDRK
ncbi:MAG: ion transporter [Lachnospiraceae bacterium]|nr:ion transporter [Lachnospiraceae bacterium]